MNFIEQEFIPKKVDKSKKTLKILLILIILVVVAIISIICVIVATKKEPLKIMLDGETKNDLKSIIKIEENGNISIPVRDIAPYLNYQSYNGDYRYKSEETDKCYIESDEEIAVFTANSNKIEKIDSDTSEVTNYLIKKPVELIDGVLYTTPEGLMEAFNVYFEYDQSKNKIIIKTMDNIVESYKETIIENGYSDISEEFNDKKAALKNLVIVKDSKGKYGIINMETGKVILETKYDNISYVPESGEFIIVSNKKMGLKDANGRDKIKINYQDIDVISQDIKLYVVELDNKYGVINATEDSVIPIKFDEIGIDIKGYERNNVSNKYVLLDEIIPVQKDEKWGLYKTDGTQITQFKYDGFGCSNSSKIKDAENVIIIPEHGLIVAEEEGKYILVNSNGKEFANGIKFDNIYMKTELGKTTYYVTRNEVTADLEKVINKLNQKNEKLEQ